MNPFQQRIDNLNKALARHKYLFKTYAKINVKEAWSMDKKSLVIYIPEDIPLGEEGGIPIQGGGFIQGKETHKEINGIVSRVAYSYKLNMDSFVYKVEGEDGIQSELKFNFRFENTGVARRGIPQNHLQVLHDMPHYQSNSINFNMFLDIIRITFFENQVRINTPPWLIS